MIKFKPRLIAPCGMNCGICKGHLREKNVCPGCRDGDIRCLIRTCEILKKNKFRFCYKCVKYPCDRIRRLDKRYMMRYQMSMIKNLDTIKSKGLDSLLKDEGKKRESSDGGVICIHDKEVYPIDKVNKTGKK